MFRISEDKVPFIQPSWPLHSLKLNFKPTLEICGTE